MVAAITLHGLLVNNLRDDGCPLFPDKGTTAPEIAACVPKATALNTLIFNILQIQLSLDRAFFLGLDTT
jgi:hypothetical protein